MEIRIQESINECGLYVLQSIHNYFYGKWFNINKLRQHTSFSEDGITLLEMEKSSSKLGFNIEWSEGSWEAFSKSKIDKPIIAILNSSNEKHYVIIKKIHNKKIIILDPAKGERKISKNEFKNLWTGVVGFLEKTTYVKSEQKKPISISEWFKFIPWILSISIFFITMNLVSGLFMKIYIDNILPTKSYKMLNALVVVTIFVSLIKVISKYFENFLSKKMQLKIYLKYYDQYFYKINNAKIHDIKKISHQEHLQKISFIENVSIYIASLISLASADITSIIYSSIILIYIDVKLFAISFMVSTLILLVFIVLESSLLKRYPEIIAKSKSKIKIEYDLLNMLPNLKHKSFGKFITGKQIYKRDQLLLLQLKVWKQKQFQNIVTSFLTSIIPIVFSYLAYNMITKNTLSVGTFLLFLNIFHHFLKPILSFGRVMVNYPLYKKQKELIEYIYLLDDEETNPKGHKLDKITSIEFKNYRYAYHSNKYLFNISKKISSNTFVKGKNGSGKSTFLDSIFYLDNYKGEIKFNNFDVKFLDKTNIREKIFKTSTRDYLPSMSIFEYLTENKTQKIKLLNESMNKYSLHILLNGLNISLNQQLNNGNNLSLGQTSILKILKLFTKKYDVLIFDEIFENIDADIKKVLIPAIIDFQKEAIILETSHQNKTFTNKEVINIEKYI